MVDRVNPQDLSNVFNGQPLKHVRKLENIPDFDPEGVPVLRGIRNFSQKPGGYVQDRLQMKKEKK